MDANITDNFDGRHTGKFFEEFILVRDDGTAKGLGSRVIESPGQRKLGVDGQMEIVLMESFTLIRGLKEITYRASRKNPMRIHTMLQRIEGRPGMRD
jgi:hypothetical protein